jgi:hypothetical protein
MATYISNGSGDWTTIPWLTAATGTLGPTAPAAGSPPSFGYDKIVIRQGNNVTYNTSGVFGDGTSGNTLGTITPNIASASIILSGGRLRASRTQNTGLTALGTIWVAAGTAATANSFLDWGTLSDPVSSVSSTISLSCSRLGSAVIYIQSSSGGTATFSNSACFCGIEKTRNTFLTLPAAASQNIIRVDSCTNWLTGDFIAIESDNTNTTRSLSARISFVDFNNKQVTLNTNLNFARLSGTRVGNFTSTVTVKSLESSPLAVGFNILGGTNSIYQFSNITLENFTPSWVRADTGGSAGPNINIQTSIGALWYNSTFNLTQPVLRKIACLQTHPTGSQGTHIAITDVPFGEIVLDDISIFSSGGSSAIMNFSSTTIVKALNSVSYRCNVPVAANGFRNTIENCYLNAETSIFSNSLNAVNLLVNNSRLRSNSQLFNFDNSNSGKFNSCSLIYGTDRFILSNNNNAYGTHTFSDCTISNPVSSYGFSTPTARTVSDASVNIYNPNNNGTSTSFNYFYHLSANPTIRKNSITSMMFRPKVPSTAFVKTFTVPAIQGVTQKIKGNLRFDSAYGIATPPSITFGGAVANTTFNCPAVIDTWNSFEYDLTPTFTGDLEITVTGTSTLSTGYVYLDGLILDPFIKDTRWYGFEVDKNAYRTVDTLTTLTENQVSSVDITNLDRLYDASNYWTINNPLSTSYLDLYTKNGDILNFGNRNIIFDNSASTNFAYASASNTITIKTPLLSSGNNFIGLRTTGTISVSSNSNFSYIDIYGNINQPTPISLSGVYMEGTLSYSTNSNTAIEYIDCAMDTVQNLSAGFVTIKKTNSTITNGNDPEILDYVPTLLNIQNLYDGSIAIFDNNGTRQYYQNAPADNIIVLPSTATGTWRYHIARYGFAFIQENFVVDGGTKTINPDYNPDTFVTGDRVTTAAYTDLNSTQRIYNYLSYYSTTSEGIEYDPFYDKAFGSITINKNVTLNTTAASVFSYNHGASLVTLKCTSLNEDVLFVSSNNVTINGTTLSDDVRVRAANLNSELLMSGVTSLTLYPSPEDRDDNTNIGEVLTGTIYRFLYGSTTPLGVLLENFIYNRVNVSGTILLNDTAIVTGRNVLQFETTGTLQQIINNQKTINLGIQKASKLIPHTTNI